MGTLKAAHGDTCEDGRGGWQGGFRRLNKNRTTWDIKMRMSTFKGRFVVKVDSSGKFDFPKEWRPLVAKDRSFYFAPTRCDDVFDLTPKKLYDMEVGLLEALVKDNNVGDIASAYKDESFEAYVDKEWQMHIPKAILKSIGAKDEISLLGALRKIMVSK